MSGEGTAYTDAVSATSNMDLLKEAIAQNSRQWETFRSTLLTILDQAQSESESRLRDLSLRLSGIPAASASNQQKSGPPIHPSPTSGPRGSPLQELTVNLTPASQHSSRSKADTYNEEMQSVLARLAAAEQERDSVKEKYKKERIKQQRFKAWWDANLAGSISTAGMEAPDEAAREPPSGGSPLKKRKIIHPSSPAPDNASAGPPLLKHRAVGEAQVHFRACQHEQDDEVLMSMSPPPPSSNRVSTSTCPDKSQALRKSFAKLHLSRSDKSLLRSVGLQIPKSPVKAAVDLPLDAPPDGPDAQGEDLHGLTYDENTIPFHTAFSEQAISSNAPSPHMALDRGSTSIKSPSASEHSVEEAEVQRTQTETIEPASGAEHTPHGPSAPPAVKDETMSDTMSINSSEPNHRVQPVAGPSNLTGSTKTVPHRIRYELDPALNRGRAFEYHEVVRGREARKQLIATDCMECEEWYAQTDAPSLSPAGPVYEPYTELGKGLRAAREERKAREAATATTFKAAAPRRSLPFLSDLQNASSSSSTTTFPPAQSTEPGQRRHHPKCKHGSAGAVRARQEEVQEEACGDLPLQEERVVYTVRVQDSRQAHRQAISRHRNTAPVSLTPPGFWDIAFPSTQRVEELNAQTEAQREAHDERMARDPRYRIRKSK
ncbi:hypothetical protein OC846_000374 [Tilletia horrida]|uniref:DNA endonuclease activator Ctp1 C-terminal domain-containing protein n=1 Tax=Tilletia horrida TaxID=155126 RepID=A0AAN6H0X9_9BASI|nr:hypothetical protein OC845_000039 [Tilletia horrida]KAK0557586.1 hypothetical protein OC846_000374 [Tilletia horrida]